MILKERGKVSNSQKTISLKKLADLTNSEVKGDDEILIRGVATLKDATQGQISFVSNPKYKNQLSLTKASAVILSEKLADTYEGNALVNNDPYLTFAKVVNIYHNKGKPASKIHPSAVLADDVKIGDDVEIAANVVIDSGVEIGSESIISSGTIIEKNVTIGERALIYPNVTIYSDTKIGADAIIHSGAVIGSDGFGFAPQKDKSWYKILQIGNVVIGKDVEVGANTTIDRAALGSTVIADGVKLDNQIQIGHNVQIGKKSIIAASTAIAGSTTIGECCQIGGAVAIAGHLEITDNVVITGRSMVVRSIKQAGVYSSGITADENRKWRRNAARFRSLDEMAKKLKELEKKLESKE